MPNSLNQVVKRYVLTFPDKITNKPIICQLVKEFQINFNILRARISPEQQGRIVMEFEGTSQQLDEAVLHLKQIGVVVESLNQEVRQNRDKCIHCGTCEGFCPTGALFLERRTMRIEYNPEKCVLCERCLTACPTHAMEFYF